MSVTIKDIAKRAGVSYATVSRAFNDKQGVNAATRAKIMEIARELRYSPNGIARGLVKRQTHTIGLILPDITNPFYPEVARGIEKAAEERGYSVFLCNTNWERKRENRYIELLTERRVDGLLIAPGSNVIDPLQERLISNIPVVYVSEVPKKTNRSFVVIDNVHGGFLATKHLIEAGHGKIAFIGGFQEPQSTNERLEGYKLAFQRYGLALEERYIRIGDFNQETGAALMREMIQTGDYPHAVFAENDLLALGVIRGARDAGLSIPKDMAVVGFDDIPFASFPEVQLTTVYQPKYDMGRIAAEILCEEIGRRGANASDGDEAATDGREDGAKPEPPAADGGKAAPYRRMILEPKLIVRKTSEAPRTSP